MEAIHGGRGAGAAEAPRAEQRLARPKAWLNRARRVARAYVGPLFELSYGAISLERLFAVVQIVGTLALAYGCVELVILGFEASTLRGLVHLFLGAPAAFFGGLAALRIALAFVLALVRIADHMEGVAGNMDDLGELPRWVRAISPLGRRGSGPIVRIGASRAEERR